MPPSVHEPIIGLPDFKIISYKGSKTVEIEVEYIGKRQCPHCQCERLRKKDSFLRAFKRTSSKVPTFANLRTHKVFDVTLGRSEASLRDYVLKIPDRENCNNFPWDFYCSKSSKSFPPRHNFSVG